LDVATVSNRLYAVKQPATANDFSVVDHVTKALRKAGIPTEEIDQFCDEALASTESEDANKRSMGHFGALTHGAAPGQRDDHFAFRSAAARLRPLSDSRFFCPGVADSVSGSCGFRSPSGPPS
jgi:hypothetical protein